MKWPGIGQELEYNWDSIAFQTPQWGKLNPALSGFLS
jgi:hypothetical protein